MATQTDRIIVKGIVRTQSLDANRIPRRICIGTPDGRLYEVEPTYVGRYLERFEGHHVSATVQPLTHDENHNVVRILSLKMLDREPANASSGHTGGVDSPP
jgi:hypothetical protein